MDPHRRSPFTYVLALCSCVAGLATAQDLPQEAEQPVTYYVGPLDGLFCMGLADEGREASSGSDGHLPHDRP